VSSHLVQVIRGGQQNRRLIFVLQGCDVTAGCPSSVELLPRHPQVALGKGSIDWVKTFQTAKTGGVKDCFVEQNWELTQQSVAYLKGLKA